MVACPFCEGANVRLSRSGRLDPAGVRLRRALTFRRLYRCEKCDALFEAFGPLFYKPRKSAEGADLSAADSAKSA